MQALFTTALLAPVAFADMKCATKGEGGSVIYVKDGNGTDRCASVITPPSAKTPMPILFWFHGGAGNAGNCGYGGSGSPGTLARQYGFALVCAEALQGYFSPNGGQWDIPEIMTNSSGTPCSSSDSVDVDYINNVIAHLGAQNGTYDVSRMFTSGCSMGSAFSGYISKCMKQETPNHISAFATHSTGLKVKGDGNTLPDDNAHDGYGWGDCPQCQYWPFVPRKYDDALGLKACIFDNTNDTFPNGHGDFFPTSVYLAKVWKQLGNKEAHTFLSGGHCEVHSWGAILDCLDDGTGRLLSGAVAPIAGGCYLKHSAGGEVAKDGATMLLKQTNGTCHEVAGSDIQNSAGGSSMNASSSAECCSYCAADSQCKAAVFVPSS